MTTTHPKDIVQNVMINPTIPGTVNYLANGGEQNVNCAELETTARLSVKQE